MRSIPERDWKTFRSLKDELLSEACERILQKVDALLVDRKGHEHERYLALWDLLKEEDDDIALMFDDPRRSNVSTKLRALRTRGLLTDDLLSRFSEETRKRIGGHQEDSSRE